MGVDGFCSDAEMEQEIAFGVSYILTVGGVLRCRNRCSGLAHQMKHHGSRHEDCG